MTSKSFLLVLAFWMASHIIFPCAKQPAIPGTPPFCTEVSIYSLMRRYLVYLDAKTTKNIFPSTLRREIGQKWPMYFEFFSLGMYTPSAIIHWLLTWKFFHAHFRLAWSQLRTLGHFFFTGKGIPLGSDVSKLYSLYIHINIFGCSGFVRGFLCIHSYKIQIIFKQIYFTHRWYPDSNTLGKSGPGSNGNKEVLHTSQIIAQSCLHF